MLHLAAFRPIVAGEDWYDVVQLIDDDTGGPIDFTGFTFEVATYPPGGRPGCCSPSLSSSTAPELSFPDGEAGGVLQILIYASRTTCLATGTHCVVIKATNGTDTVKMIGSLPVKGSCG